MKLKSVYKVLAVTTLLAQFSGLPDTSFAETEKETTQKNQPQTKQTLEQEPAIGFIGYYFKDDAFKDLAFIQVGEKSTLMDKKKVQMDEQKIHSVQWIGNLKPSQTGDYTLSTSLDKNVILKINGETVINGTGMNKSIKLEKDKLYEIKIEYQNKTESQSDLQVFWSNKDGKKTQIPEGQILSPKISENEDSSDKNVNKARSLKSSLIADSDGDGIPDDLEETGYTFKDNQIVAWNDSFASLGYKKYVSNPRKARTAADPYTDFEKVIGHMPAATKDDARDPLVAAYPSVGVGMEKLYFSKNETVTEGDSGTVSKTTTKTDTTTNNVEVGGQLGWGEKGFSFSISPKYSHSWSNSTAIADTDSTTWSSQIGINPSERAYLNANVRYYNGGTAPIYDVRPTSNFVLQNSGSSIATVTAGPNQIGNSLAPGATYPAKGQAPISLDKANEAGTMKISVDAPTLDKLQDRTETVNLETTQNRGQYAILDEGGTPITDPTKQWDPIRTNVDAISGSLILNLGPGKENLERRVTAKNVNDPEDKTPELTIKEAIKKAFNAKEKDGRLYYTDQDRKDIFIDEPAINLIGDENTKKEIESQLSHMPGKTVYDVKWKRGMNITLHVPIAYYDFESGHQGWTYSSNLNGGHTGKKHQQIGPNNKGYGPHYQLKKSTSYTARAYVRTDSTTGSNDVQFFIDNNNGDGQGAKVSGKVKGNQWKLIEFSFNTGNNPEQFKYLGFHNVGNSNLQFDDVSVTEWQATEDIQKKHVFEQWNYDPTRYGLTSVTFTRVPSSTIRYQWKIDGNWGSIKPAPPVDANGKRTINLDSREYTPVIHAQLYAVDEKNDNLKVKVAEYDRDQVGKEVVDAHNFANWVKMSNGSYHYANLHALPSNLYSHVERYKIRVNGKSTQSVSKPTPSNNLIAFDLFKANGSIYYVGRGASVEIWAVVGGKDFKVLEKWTS
ncbi:binary toxin-like calcium binding domain-containing protein [Bacillus thuringiensis]|uniref:Iota Ib/vip n=1 Tax=Bacillus thuringiensis TaxID=1428 RepID=S5YZN2_BACTU|nr:binary toxin-like calcium binding domain-containing protein [Bacillus thuringiensis]AGT29561.1 iota Ib/vip [Bacillus thuringiensis]ARX70182.1 Iota toxin protein Ib [Bacillus thuringiensis]MEB9697895.1 PA14 domain-containing protein [Bacillus cereus]